MAEPREVRFDIEGFGDPISLTLRVAPLESPASVVEAYARSGRIVGLDSRALQTLVDGGWNYSLNAPDGPERIWVLLLDGEQIRFDWFRDLRHVYLSDLEATAAAGYLKGNPHHVIVYTDGGYGGDGAFADLAGFLLQQGVDLGAGAGLGWLGGMATKWIRLGLRDRRARYVAWRLMDGNGLTHPGTLRIWMDTQDTWIPSDITRRLGLPIETSVQLLKALGYRRDAGGTWRLGSKKKDRERRQRWLKAEDKLFTDPDRLWFSLPACENCGLPLTRRKRGRRRTRWRCPQCGHAQG